MEKVTLFPNKRLAMWGVRFLLFQQLVLPYLLEWLDYALDLNLDASKMNLLFYTVNFAVLVGIFWRFLQVNLQHALQNIGTVLVPAIIGFFACRFISTVLDTGIYYLFPDFFNVNDANISTMAENQLPLWAFGTIVLVPPVEELLFRGTLFGGIYNRSKVLAWIVSVLGFALMHVLGYVGYYSWDMLLICTLQYLPAGVCLAAAYRKSGNILTPIVMHAALNGLAMLSMAVM